MGYEKCASLNSWLPQTSKLQRKIILKKLKRDLERRGMTRSQVYKGLLNLATTPRVLLDRLSIGDYRRLRSHTVKDIAKDERPSSPKEIHSDTGNIESAEVTARLTNGFDDKDISARELCRSPTPELLDENVGDQSPVTITCRIPRKLIMLNLNPSRGIIAKRASQQTRADTEIRIADSSVSDSENAAEYSSDKFVAKKDVDDDDDDDDDVAKVTESSRTSKIVEDVIFSTKHSKISDITEDTNILEELSTSPDIIENENSFKEISKSRNIPENAKIHGARTKKPRIVGDWTCLEGTIIDEMRLVNSSKVLIHSEKHEKSMNQQRDDLEMKKFTNNRGSVSISREIHTTRINRTCMKMRLRRKFRQLFGNDLTSSDEDEENAMIERFLVEKRHEDLRVSLDSGVGITDLGTDDIAVCPRENSRDESVEKGLTLVREINSMLESEEKNIVSDPLVRSMPLLDSIFNDEIVNDDDIFPGALPDSSTSTDEKTTIDADSSIGEQNNGKLTILISPVNMESPDAFTPVSLEIDVPSESQISTPTSTTGYLSALQNSSMDDPDNRTNSMEDLTKILEIDVFNESCSIILQGNTINIQENTRNVITPEVVSSGEPVVDESCKDQSMIIEYPSKVILSDAPVDFSTRGVALNLSAEYESHTDDEDISSRDSPKLIIDEASDDEAVDKNPTGSPESPDYADELGETSMPEVMPETQVEPIDLCSRERSTSRDEDSPIVDVNQAKNIENTDRSENPTELQPPPPPVPKFRVLHHRELGSRWCPTPISNDASSSCVDTNVFPHLVPTIPQVPPITKIQQCPVDIGRHEDIQQPSSMQYQMTFQNQFPNVNSSQILNVATGFNDNHHQTQTWNPPQQVFHQSLNAPLSSPITTSVNQFSNDNITMLQDTLLNPIVELLLDLHWCIQRNKAGSNFYDPVKLQKEFKVKKEYLYLEMGKLCSLIGSSIPQNVVGHLMTRYKYITPPESRILTTKKVLEILNLTELPPMRLSPAYSSTISSSATCCQPVPYYPLTNCCQPVRPPPPSYPLAQNYALQNPGIPFGASPNVTIAQRVLMPKPNPPRSRGRKLPTGTIFTQKQLLILKSQIEMYQHFEKIVPIQLAACYALQQKNELKREKRRATAEQRRKTKNNNDKQAELSLAEAVLRNSYEQPRLNNSNEVANVASVSPLFLDDIVMRKLNELSHFANVNNNRAEIPIAPRPFQETITRNSNAPLYSVSANNEKESDAMLPTLLLEDILSICPNEPSPVTNNQKKPTEAPSLSSMLEETNSRDHNEPPRLKNNNKEQAEISALSSIHEETISKDPNDYSVFVCNNETLAATPSSLVDEMLSTTRNEPLRLGNNEMQSEIERFSSLNEMRDQKELALISAPSLNVNRRVDDTSENCDNFINDEPSPKDSVSFLDVLREFDVLSSSKKKRHSYDNNNNNNGKRRKKEEQPYSCSESSMTPGGSSMPVCTETSTMISSSTHETDVNDKNDIQKCDETKSRQDVDDQNDDTTKDNEAAATITMDQVAVITLDDNDTDESIEFLERPEISSNLSILDVKSISKDVFNNLGDCDEFVESSSVSARITEISNEHDDDGTAVMQQSIDCFRCRKPSTLGCEQCCQAFYCSSECHEADWIESHHLICKPVTTPRI